MEPTKSNAMFGKVWFYHVGRRDILVGEVTAVTSGYGEVLGPEDYAVVAFKPSEHEDSFVTHVKPSNIIYPLF